MEFQVYERIGILSAKADAAHLRLDSLEENLRDDLKALNDEIKTLNGHMNRGKGYAAAIAGISGVVIVILERALSYFIK